jgi:hypothetical protein
MKKGLTGWLVFIIIIAGIVAGLFIKDESSGTKSDNTDKKHQEISGTEPDTTDKKYIEISGTEPDSTDKKYKETGVNVKDLGVLPNDGVDRTELFQSILDNNRNVFIPKGEYTISSGKYRNGDGSVWWGLKVPSNTHIHFEDGAILRFKDNMPLWSRLLAIYKVENVQITGHLEIDGNSDSVTNGNEHMANLHIESSKNVYIESVNSHDSYGDNIFVGGTEADPSENIRMDYVKGVRAGRKNYVIHYVNNLYVKRAILDNSKGNSTNGWTGANSIDLEPDNYTGKTRFYQRFDYVSTYGKGNDFTVGTSSLNAKNWILDIGTLDVHRMKSKNTSADNVLYSNAVTAKIDKLNILVPTGENAVPIKLLYSAIWDVRELTIQGGNQYGISLQYSGNEKPSLVVKKLKMNDVRGYGIRNEGGDVNIGTFVARNVSGRVFHNFSTSPDSEVNVDSLTAYDSGGTEIIKVSSLLTNPVQMNIGTLKVFDTKVRRLIYIETGSAADGLTIGKIHNPSKIMEFAYASGLAKKYYRY